MHAKPIDQWCAAGGHGDCLLLDTDTNINTEVFVDIPFDNGDFLWLIIILPGHDIEEIIHSI